MSVQIIIIIYLAKERLQIVFNKNITYCKLLYYRYREITAGKDANKYGDRIVIRLNIFRGIVKKYLVGCKNDFFSNGSSKNI